MYQIYANNAPIYSPVGNGAEFAVLNPKWTQEVNKAGQLTFSMPTQNAAYNTLKKLTVPVSIYRDMDEVFFGRVYSVEKDFYNNKSVVCEGALAFLNDVIVRPFSYTDMTADCVRNFVAYILALYNLECGEEWKKIHLGEVTVRETNNYLYRHKETYEDAFTVLIEQTVKSSLGGYLSIRRSGGKTYLDYTAESGKQSTQYIEFGKNLLDLTQNATAEDVFTVLIPLGAKTDSGYVTIKSVNGGRDYLESESGIAEYGRITEVRTYDDITAPSALIQAARADLALGIQEDQSLSLSAVDMQSIGVDTDAFQCGDRIPVLSVPHGVNTFFVCSKTDIALDDPSKSSYQMGATQAGLSDQQATVMRSATSSMSSSESALAVAETASATASAASTTAQDASETASSAVARVTALEARTESGTEEVTVAAESYEDVSVTFGSTMGIVPVVMLQSMSSADVVLTVISRSESGFTARAYNNGAASEAVSFAWLAQS